MMTSTVSLKSRTQLQQVQSAMREPALYWLLQQMYPWEPMLERSGLKYPVAVYYASKDQGNQPESILIGLDTRPLTNEDFLFHDPSYRHVLTKTGKRLLDLPTYTMSEFCSTPSLGLRCGLGSYFQTLDTCDALEWELCSQWDKLSRLIKRNEEYWALLPLRSKLHLEVSDPVRLGFGRCVGLAVSTLIAFYDGDKPFLWLQKRSSNTISPLAGLLHVFPSFMLQPSCISQAKGEFSIMGQFYREYLEELFNYPQGLAAGGLAAVDCLNRLKKYLENGEALFLFTGVAVNLLNLRPEICTLLFIRTPEWFTYHSKLAPVWHNFCCNEEFIEFEKPGDGEIFGSFVPYNDQDSELVKAGHLFPDRVVPSGAAAFWLGVDTLRKVM